MSATPFGKYLCRCLLGFCVVAACGRGNQAEAAADQAAGRGWHYEPVTQAAPAMQVPSGAASQGSTTQSANTPQQYEASPDEPLYKGKPLGYWVIFERHTMASSSSIGPGLDEDGREAVRHAGTNAIPFLLRWLGSGHTVEALGVLGPLAKAAIPKLLHLATNQVQTAANQPRFLRNRTQHSAAIALWQMGPDAIPAASSVLTNSTAREARTTLLAQIAGSRTNGIPWVPALTECLSDRDGAVVAEALLALRMVQARDEATFAAVLAVLGNPNPRVRSRALEALASFGDRAEPALLRGLSDKDVAVSADALILTVETAPRTLTNTTVISLGAEGLSAEPSRQKWAAQLLRAAGQQARGLKPDLIVRLPGGWHSVLREATNVLRELAPDLLRGGPSRPDRPANASP